MVELSTVVTNLLDNKMLGLETEPAEIMTTHPYTCNSCQIAFRTSNLQRGHMRSDWHRYNLKRRVISLPPISSEIFTEKVLRAQANSTAAATKAVFEKTCDACVRTYFSENAFRNHLSSQRHKAKSASTGKNEIENLSVMSSTFSLGTPVIDENDESYQWKISKASEKLMKINLVEDVNITQLPEQAHQRESQEDNDIIKKTSSNPVPVLNQECKESLDFRRCLFCNLTSDSLRSNISHMEKLHGLFIPEKNFLVDLEGLIAYLHAKIYEYHECLYCGKLKISVFGLQTHMRDKGHCKIPFFTETEQLEIGDFYDFTSTYSDSEVESNSECSPEGKKLNKGAKLGSRREVRVFDSYHDIIDTDEGWETDGSESTAHSTLSYDQITHQDKKPNQLTRHASSNSEYKSKTHGLDHNNIKSEYSVLYSDYELYLPTGRIAGHRSMNKYFKQNLHNFSSVLDRQNHRGTKTITQFSDEEKNRVNRHGGKGCGRELTMAGVSEGKRSEVIALEMRSRKVEERGRRRNEWIVNKQKNSQKHFRDPLLQ